MSVALQHEYLNIIKVGRNSFFCTAEIYELILSRVCELRMSSGNAFLLL